MDAERLKLLLKEHAERKDYEFNDETVEKTIVFVKKAHGDTVDKMNVKYYLHPYRVCDKLMETFGESPFHTNKQINYACVLALLHDVVEDTEYTPEMIAKELELNAIETDELTYGLKFITHDKERMSYSEYIKEIAEAPIIYPAWVKYCDLLDNSSLNRANLSNGRKLLMGEDIDRMNKYLTAVRVMRERIYGQNANFKVDEEDIKLIDMFRTPAEARRMEKRENAKQK